MALLRRVLKSSESLFSKNWSITHGNIWNIECVFSTKKVDIPSPPKRPLTAYMIFCKENRNELLKENPALTSPEQIKRLAAKWGELTVDMKKPYEISARQSTLVYGEEHKHFYENLSEEQKEELARLKEQKRESRRKHKLNKALKESGMPKSVLSAYTLFVKSQAKDKTHNQKASDFITVAAEKWRNLSQEDKEPFEKQALAEKKRFDSEMEAWRKKVTAEGNVKLLKAYEALKSNPKQKSV